MQQEARNPSRWFLIGFPANPRSQLIHRMPFGLLAFLSVVLATTSCSSLQVGAHGGIPVFSSCPTSAVAIPTPNSRPQLPQFQATAQQLGFSGYSGVTYTTSKGVTYVSDYDHSGKSWHVGEQATVRGRTYKFEAATPKGNGPKGTGFYYAECVY